MLVHMNVKHTDWLQQGHVQGLPDRFLSHHGPYSRIIHVVFIGERMITLGKDYQAGPSISGTD